MPPTAIPSNAGYVSLRNSDTGNSVRVPERTLDTSLLPSLRRRLRLGDVQSSWAGEAADAVRIDPKTKSYTFARYPPLGFFMDVRWFIVLGAFFIAGCAQVQFLFPCRASYTALTYNSASYCVPTNRVSDVTTTVCPVDICSKRIPVTMREYWLGVTP